jgi:uracil-DNA glycosylase
MNNIDISWKLLFDNYEFDLDSVYDGKNPVYPNKENVFRVFKMPVNDIKLVFLGQDCYHNDKNNIPTADGLCFSSKIAIPPSLRNIFKEIKNEFPEREYNFTHGDLSLWAERENIFLLNCALSVEKGEPESHMDIWCDFTDDVIKYISEKNNNCVFLLLGNFAKQKSSLIKNKKNIITGIHPSPLSASRGFFNSGIFKKIEKIVSEINWQN